MPQASEWVGSGENHGQLWTRQKNLRRGNRRKPTEIEPCVQNSMRFCICGPRLQQNSRTAIKASCALSLFLKSQDVGAIIRVRGTRPRSGRYQARLPAPRFSTTASDHRRSAPALRLSEALRGAVVLQTRMKRDDAAKSSSAGAEAKNPGRTSALARRLTHASREAPQGRPGSREVAQSGLEVSTCIFRPPP